MVYEHIPLFTSDLPRQFGVGFHNVGATGSLRAANPDIAKKAEAAYAGRCGHLPLQAGKVGLLLETPPTPDLCRQLAHLSYLFGKAIEPVSLATLQEHMAYPQDTPGQRPLVVPYINVPEAETLIQETLGAETWGLPGKIVHLLKNKAEFYQFLATFPTEDFQIPEYRVATVDEFTREASCFLREIEALYAHAGLAERYPLGLVVRAAESEGARCSCLIYEKDGQIMVVQNDEAHAPAAFRAWSAALHGAQQGLVATMNTDKEDRVVISRYLDVQDSPGLSVIIIEGQVASLGWNSQWQREGHLTCIGVSSYLPKTAEGRRAQEQYEARSTAFFSEVLRKAAATCGIAFNTLHGIANIDLMIPGGCEQRLRQQRKQPPALYLAECNPRWTNYTDAVMTVLGASRRTATIHTMRTVIQEGMMAFAPQPLPAHLDPAILCERIIECDDAWQQRGLRIICRLVKNPMSLIYVGDVRQAQQEMEALLWTLTEQKPSQKGSARRVG